MPSKTAIPLGYIDLPTGKKPVYPMTDLFLNYAFETPENWEALRNLTNHTVEAYIQYNPATTSQLIKGAIEVRTQFKYLIGAENRTRDQDLKLTEQETDNATYLEFQNRGKPSIPIEIKSMEYFGLGIGNSKGNLANQIWLLGEDVDAVLHGEMFARYVLKDEVTGVTHPATSGILYVSLPKLSQEKTPAGELAAFLLGKINEPKNDAIKNIADVFKHSFKSFKDEKVVASVWSIAERYKHDGLVEGEAKVAAEARDLFENGMDPADILRIIISKADSKPQHV